ncbi:hypothetical protein [Duganella flavida]|uniref:hypothetical protein n=1 Tax=Duganella flavida TaxID=2692175 RepID=UPI001926C52E|nr:hypothetical protein [Duganella flavida]
MSKYLISFPSDAMVAPDDEFAQVGLDARAVIAEAKVAGVYVYAGGINESAPPVNHRCHCYCFTQVVSGA